MECVKRVVEEIQPQAYNKMEILRILLEKYPKYSNSILKYYLQEVRHSKSEKYYFPDIIKYILDGSLAELHLNLEEIMSTRQRDSIKDLRDAFVSRPLHIRRSPTMVGQCRDCFQTKTYDRREKRILFSHRGMPSGFTRLSTDMPTFAEYEWSGKKIKRSVRHIGQRKLLVSEIEFLSYVYKNLGKEEAKKHTVVYAGAADGAHLPYMIRTLFGGVFKEWHLYDEPHRFNKRLLYLPEVKIAPYIDTTSVEGYFTPYHHSIYKGKKVIFISDIRRATNDEMVAEDNALQNATVIKVNPKYAMLKFRFPFDGGDYEVLDGPRILQCWAKKDSAEVRLWSKSPHKLVTMSSKEHETRMNAFNLYYRPTPFQYEVAGGTKKNPHWSRVWGYDDMAEYYILIKWCEAFGKNLSTAFSIKMGIEKHYAKRG